MESKIPRGNHFSSNITTSNTIIILKVNTELVNIPIANSSTFLVYADLNFAQSYIYGGCSSWNVLLTQTIKSSLRKKFIYLSVSISFVDNLAFNHDDINTITCSNSTITQQIANGLNDISNQLYSNASLSCDGHIWNMKHCPFQVLVS